ncbi:unnamed protein product [Lactuca saligna]|uniref:Uncharacterized protein n=1 Tax=Lactuca saligna TaxID=75948 RepID=A0AA35YY50_LACSI|nr:unnamed protein product [Lactuca saligna]
MVLPNDVDLLNPPDELAKRNQKLKRLVQSPNSFFMDFKCQKLLRCYYLKRYKGILVKCIVGRDSICMDGTWVFLSSEDGYIDFLLKGILARYLQDARLVVSEVSSVHLVVFEVRSESALTLRALAEIDPTCVGGLVNYGITTLKALRENVSFEKEDSFCKRAARKLLLEFKSDSFSKATVSDGTIIIVLGDAQTCYIVNVVREENEKAVRLPPSISIEIYQEIKESVQSDSRNLRQEYHKITDISLVTTSHHRRTTVEHPQNPVATTHRTVTTSHHRKTTVEANPEKSRYHCKSAIHFRCKLVKSGHKLAETRVRATVARDEFKRRRNKAVTKVQVDLE